MSEAIRKGRSRTTKRKNLAKDHADVYTIYVNPLAKERDDPEQLQQRANSILKSWKEDGILKENILKAVLQFTEAESSQEVPKDMSNRELLNKISERMHEVFGNIQLIAAKNSSHEVVDYMDSLSDDMLDFASEFMNYGE